MREMGGGKSDFCSMKSRDRVLGRGNKERKEVWNQHFKTVMNDLEKVYDNMNILRICGK